ncbi:MAG: hypothetical protein ACAH59_05600 [Pseudobdellovibrionaceae bacterium]
MRTKKLFRLLGVFGLGLGLVVFYNNCGKGQTAENFTSFSSSGIVTYNAADICSEEDITVFSRGFHPFLSYTCKNCHVDGPGKGTFASPDVKTAFAGFMQVGYSKISQYAVSGSHNPPYTGSQNTEVISSFRLQWQTYQRDKAQCGTTTPVAEVYKPEFETASQLIPKINGTTTTTRVNGANVTITNFDRRVLTWNLNSSLVSLNGKTIPNLTGVQLSVTVTGMLIPSGETAYVFSLPTLKVGTSSLHVKGLNFRLNGFPISYATTFKNLDINAYMGTTALLSPGSLVSVGPLGASDTLAVQLNNIEIIDLPAPPPPPSVRFTLSNLTIQPTQLGIANKVTITVQVDGDMVDPISVPVQVASTYPSGEIPAVGIVGEGRNRFDWDYQFDPSTSTSLNINPSQKTVSFNVIFSDDLRNDPDKVLRLELGDPLGAVLGTNKTLRISLPDYNPAYTGSAPTFAQLMNPKSGILGVNCVKCHNSVQRQGGYDMTDYREMVSKGIIVPGNPNLLQHKMYRRIRADLAELEGLQSMPLDGYRPQNEIDLITEWLAAGAQNN